RLLEKILVLRNQGTRWTLGGKSPPEGFDSPGFAAFVLQETNHLPFSAQGAAGQMRRMLGDRLTPVQQPEAGDLVFYRTGYVMFYFKDPQNRPFVVGMTPFGITALNPQFAEVTGYRRFLFMPR